MNKIITRSILALALSLTVTHVSPASAASGNVSGTVFFFKIQDRTGNSYVILNSTTSVAQCIKGDGRVMGLIPDNDHGKAMIAVIEAAWLAGKSLTMTVDDYSGAYCTITSLSI